MNDPLEAHPDQPGIRRPARPGVRRLTSLIARICAAPSEPAVTAVPATTVPAPRGCVYAVRRDWADGTHDFIGPAGTTVYAGAALWNSEHMRWRRAPWRPHLTVVPVSLHDFWLHAHHRHDCRSPDCPTAIQVRA